MSTASPHCHLKNRILTTFLIPLTFLFAASTAAQNTGYMMPPKEIADLIDAPPTPWVTISPDNQWILIVNRPGLPSIEEVSQPELRLAGLRINPRTNGPSRARYDNGFTFKNINDNTEIPVTGFPDNPLIDDVSWSPNGKWIAFTLTTTNKMELWAANIENAQARRISDIPLNGAYGTPFSWVSDSKTLIVRTIPAGRGDPSEEPSIPTGPVIQENLGTKAPARTYADLLQNEYDESLYEYYATSQLAKITLEGVVTLIGDPGIIRSAEPSPDGKYILVETIHRSFSYTLPTWRFPVRKEVWNMDGSLAHQIADLPLADQIPITHGSVRAGPRYLNWRADGSATLYWVEALDGGDAGVETDQRDQVYMLPPPFDTDPIPLITLGLRLRSVLWGTDDLAIVNSYWWKTRTMRSWKVQPGSSDAEPVLMIERSWEDRYSDPGHPLRKPTDKGTYVLITANQGNTIFLSGDGASPEGDRPFLDEYDISTHETTRLFHSEAPNYEYVSRIIDLDKRQVITRRESINENPNYYLRDLNNNEITQITAFPHPTPQLIGVQKEQIRYQRADDVDLTATLYLPPGYTTDDGPLPTIMWAYPQEFKSADHAGQVTDSPYRFIRVGWWSPQLWLTQGYAVLNDPTMPIVGEGDDEPNDVFVEQLVASAQAAVDEVVRRGVTDPDRIAIGGHSYGAFMAMNLLAHSDLFSLGLPRTGAYNRTLTPFGFQSEERSLWEAPDVYFQMSPFMHADKVNEPVLMVHGDADNNSGTFPMQSERMYSALAGHGATVRLVMLPHESHGYRARESVMHVLYETTDWLNRYLKEIE